jgi:hypothetical protein
MTEIEKMKRYIEKYKPPIPHDMTLQSMRLSLLRRECPP